MTRERLLERVWGLSFPGGTRTVDVHVAPAAQEARPARPDPHRARLRVQGRRREALARASLAARAAVPRHRRRRSPCRLVVTLAVGALLTRRSLDDDARRSLDRQVELIAAQHAATPIAAARTTEHRPLPRDRAGAARDPDAARRPSCCSRDGAARAPRGTARAERHRRRPRRASSSTPRGVERRRRDRAAALGAQPGRRLDAVPRRARPRRRSSARRSPRSSRSLLARAVARPGHPRRGGEPRGSPRARAPSRSRSRARRRSRQLADGVQRALGGARTARRMRSARSSSPSATS